MFEVESFGRVLDIVVVDMCSLGVKDTVSDLYVLGAGFPFEEQPAPLLMRVSDGLISANE